jgi:ribosomal protein L20
MEGLKAAQCDLNRISLAELAARDAAAFADLIQLSQNALKSKKSA